MRNNLPYLFYIGTQKAGSTLLYNALKNHPDIALSEMTEINFFSSAYDRGMDWYKSVFPEKGVSIDTTPKYFMLADTVAPRLKEYANKYLEQEPKFLLILRNPIDYLNSHFEMQKIQEANTGNSKKKNYSLIKYTKEHPGYLGRAKYAQKLSIWLKYFSLKNFKIIIFEDLIKNKQEKINEILDFFNLERMLLPVDDISKNALLKYSFLHKIRGRVVKNKKIKEYLKQNKIFNFIYDKFLTKKSKELLSENDRKYLKNIFQNDVQELKNILNNQIKEWKDFYEN